MTKYRLGTVPGWNAKRRLAWPAATLSDTEWNPNGTSNAFHFFQ
nr:MAG TPA: hypothetical protein [Caudoviricetes sp.]